VADDAPLVVGSAMAAVATGRVKLPFNLVQGQEISPVRHGPVRTVAVFDRGLYFRLIGMAVRAKGAETSSLGDFCVVRWYSPCFFPAAARRMLMQARLRLCESKLRPGKRVSLANRQPAGVNGVATETTSQGYPGRY